MANDPTDIDLIVGEPMVCEQHPWRLWEGNDEGCAGPGMPLSAAEGAYKRVHEAPAGGSMQPMVAPLEAS